MGRNMRRGLDAAFKPSVDLVDTVIVDKLADDNAGIEAVEAP